jgi:hypothetical protein
MICPFFVRARNLLIVSPARFLLRLPPHSAAVSRLACLQMGRLQKFAAQAAALASLSNGSGCGGSRHGAVIVKGGKAIATGFNSSRTRVRGTNHLSTHAELAAISCLLRA